MRRNLLGQKSKVNVYSLADLAAISITYRRSKPKSLYLCKIRTNEYRTAISDHLEPASEEEAEVGDKRFSWTIQIREVREGIPFDHAAIPRLTNSPLIKQFNEAKNAKSPVDRFIGLFKILEDSYGGICKTVFQELAGVKANSLSASKNYRKRDY